MQTICTISVRLCVVAFFIYAKYIMTQQRKRSGSRTASRSSHSKYTTSYGRGNSSRSHRRSRSGKQNKRVKNIGSAAITGFIKQAASEPKPQIHEIKHSFADFDFVHMLHKNILAMGYTIPTAIQDQTIPHIMHGRDVVGLANTGTGKTAAFLLPLLQRLIQKQTKRVLIITPTRELATQIEAEFRKFSRGMQLYSTVCIGGMPTHMQLRGLKRSPHVVIGTPGRLKDLRKRHAIHFDQFSTIVIDEVDCMLDMGFLGSIKEILAESATRRQSLFFSATMPPAIQKVVQQFTYNPVEVSVSTGKTAHNVEQVLVHVKDKAKKLDQLKELLAQPEYKKVLIFSETKREVEKLAKDLHNTGHRADSIHGDKRQRQRDRSLSNFRKNSTGILVATDVAARGLDIKEVTHVINYSIPQTYADYIHRIGRTGRGDHSGTAITFV